MDVIILAGGRGTRLAETVPDMPKPLAPIAGRPFLNYIMDLLKTSGLAERIIISTGYKAEKFRAWAQSQPKKPEIKLVEEGEPLGTGGALLNALDAISVSNPVLVMNGDSLAKLDLKALHKQHCKSGASLTLVVVQVDNVGRYGEVELAGERVTAFHEKSAKNQSGWINAGIYMINPDALATFKRGTSSFEKDIVPSLLSSGVGAYQSADTFIDIGTAESYAAAAQILGS